MPSLNGTDIQIKALGLRRGAVWFLVQAPSVLNNFLFVFIFWRQSSRSCQPSPSFFMEGSHLVLHSNSQS